MEGLPVYPAKHSRVFKLAYKRFSLLNVSVVNAAFFGSLQRARAHVKAAVLFCHGAALRCSC
jgi:hypothetical protein